MIELDVKWGIKHKDFGFVHPLEGQRYLGLVEGGLKKYTLFCLETKTDLWSFEPSKRCNHIGGYYLVGDHILISESDDKGCIWYSLSITTGNSEIVEGLGKLTYFCFALGGYAVFKVDGKPVVVDPTQAKSIEIHGNNLEFGCSAYVQGRCMAQGKLSNLRDDVFFVVNFKVDAGAAYFGQKIELKGDPEKGELGGVYRDNDFILIRYYETLFGSSFAVFDWRGKYLRELDLSGFLSEGEKEPQGMAAGDGKFVFHVRNREKAKDKFIGVDL